VRRGEDVGAVVAEVDDAPLSESDANGRDPQQLSGPDSTDDKSDTETTVVLSHFKDALMTSKLQARFVH
jgi:hypothetical protein